MMEALKSMIAALKAWGQYDVAIGSFKIVPLDAAIALVAFVVIIMLTRMLKRLLRYKILPRTHLDSGLRDSIVTFLGYAGNIVGLLVMLSVLGINLTSIALIAGALSVGIGFGLQNIVNNFVSGIILLIERPIKVGDWVVVGENEGIVTGIRVRATEIETFQKANVIIPNADLLQSAVKNWSHNNRLARIDIGVDVDYSSDVDLVEKVLLECVTSYPGALKEPPPSVVFQDFGASGLRFEVRFHIGEVGNSLTASSEMRKRMFAALKAAHISIPFNILDLRVHEQVQVALAQRAEQAEA